MTKVLGETFDKWDMLMFELRGLLWLAVLDYGDPVSYPVPAGCQRVICTAVAPYPRLQITKWIVYVDKRTGRKF